jgi:type I restriction enzyme S subunit
MRPIPYSFGVKVYTSTGSNNRIGDCTLAPKDLNHNFSSHIFKLNPKKEINKFYLFALLKSNYGKEACDLEIPKAGIMRRGGKRFLNLKIPFPTTKNNPTSENVEKLVSLIVQNIIDKEEQIRAKNKLIDEKIEQELRENQKENSFSYAYPRISEIKEERRLDTGLYEAEYKNFNFLVKNYAEGFFKLEDKGYEISRGQNLQITNIGKSYYSEKKLNNKFYTMIFSSNISEDSVAIGKSYLGNIRKLKCIENEDIIFCSRGAQFGRVAVFPEIEKNTITNIDNMHIKNKSANLPEKIYICQFLRHLRKIKHLYKIAIFGNGSFSFTKYHLLDLSFPDFPEHKQKEIAKLYYNKLYKNTSLTFGNYLEKEKVRNKELGVFQLNMEIFRLRDVLEELVHKIVMEEKIMITLDY